MMRRICITRVPPPSARSRRPWRSAALLPSLALACCILLSGCQSIRRWRATSDASSAERMKQMEKQVEVLTEKLEKLEYELRFNVANNHVSLGKYQDAIREFREVVRINPSSRYAADSLYEIAKINKYNLKNTRQAVATYEELLNGYPKSEFTRRAKFEIAESLSELGKKSEAVAQYRKVVDGAARDAIAEKAYFQLGDLYKEERNCLEARKNYEKLVELFPNGDLRPAALYQMAYCSLALSDTASAMREYERVYTEFPARDFAELAMFDRITAMVAQNSDSDARSAIGAYMIRYPNGRFRAEAERFLAKIDRKKPPSP